MFFISLMSNEGFNHRNICRNPSTNELMLIYRFTQSVSKNTVATHVYVQKVLATYSGMHRCHIQHAMCTKDQGQHAYDK